MSFLNFSLLFGSLFIAVPIILHLAMRQRPKPMVFPAVQFLRQRKESNTRRLQLRHLILLLLRCLAIALVAAALMRPAVNSARVGDWILLGLLGAFALGLLALFLLALWWRRGRLIVGGLAAAAAIAGGVWTVLLVLTLQHGGSAVALGNPQAPVAAVLVFDTAPRVQYRQNNQTRIEVARETANWLLRQFPLDSEVAVLESRAQPAVFSIDLAAAKKAIERLEPTGAPRSFPDVVADAVRLAADSSLSRREVYVFTDLTESAWPADAAATLRRGLADAGDVLLYVIDVGAESPVNVALGELRLSGQVLARNSPLRIETEVTSLNAAGQRTVELYLEEPDPSRPVIRDGELLLPEARRRSREIVDLPTNGSQRVQLQMQGLELGTHHGYVRIVGQDGLAEDDVRWFTVSVQQAWPVLVVEPPGGTSRFLVEAIAPYELRQTGQAGFACQTIPASDLLNRQLADYAAVCLLDPAPLTPDVWQKLHDYVAAGGGLAVFLGHNAAATTTFDDEVAQRVLPGKLQRQWRSAARDVFLAPTSYDHPVLAEFRSLATSVPWSEFPVFHHWQLAPLAGDARVLIRYNQGNPALIERPIGKGRVVTLTTPISDPARPAGRPTWNELPTGENAWPYFVLVNELMRYLVESGETRLNYQAGETAVLNNQAQRDPERYRLFTPGDEPQEVTAQRDRVTVRFTENPGSYRLKGERGGPVTRGFSVNLPSHATDLTRTNRERLDTLLGEGRYQFARGREEIELGIGEARAGREFYPLLVLMLAVVLGLEHLLGNRFYRKSE